MSGGQCIGFHGQCAPPPRPPPRKSGAAIVYIDGRDHYGWNRRQEVPIINRKCVVGQDKQRQLTLHDQCRSKPFGNACACWFQVVRAPLKHHRCDGLERNRRNGLQWVHDRLCMPSPIALPYTPHEGLANGEHGLTASHHRDKK